MKTIIALSIVASVALFAFAGTTTSTLSGVANSERCETEDDVLRHMHRSRNGVSLTCPPIDRRSVPE